MTRERKNELQRDYASRHRSQEFQRVENWRSRNPEKNAAQRSRWFSRHNLPTKEKKAGRSRPSHCELCGRLGSIQFDHDHKTGRFRGWLCSPCNRVLGLVRENVQTLQHMIEYLEAGGFGPTPKGNV